MHERPPSMTQKKAILKQVPTWTTPGSSAGEAGEKIMIALLAPQFFFSAGENYYIRATSTVGMKRLAQSDSICRKDVAFSGLYK